MSHPLTALKRIYAFSLTFLINNLLDSNLSKVSTDAKSNPEFVKPKCREMPYCKDNHICVHGSDYQFAKSLSCTMRNVEQNARICLLARTWLEILDITHVILCGDDRFILCADDHLSANFACMYAIGQIAKQLIFVSISSSSTMRFIHINEYEYMNNNVQYINLHTRIRICIYVVFIHGNILTIMFMLLTFNSKGSSLVAHLQCMMCDLWSAGLLQNLHTHPSAGV